MTHTEAAGPQSVPEPLLLPRTALPLCTAHLDHLARSAGLRLVGIKGQVAQAQGVRPAKASSDVDVLCHPDDHGAFVSLLESHGWEPVPVDDALGVFPQHSVTFFHPSWPASIDVHHRYPGMGAVDDTAAFEALWAERVTVEIAHWPVHAPSTEAHLVIIALTGLREPWSPSGRGLLAWLFDRWRADDAELARCLAIAEGMQALPALRSHLEGSGLPAAHAVEWENVGPVDRNWLLVSHTQHAGTLRLAQLLGAPWKARLSMVRAALVPSREGLAYTAPELGADDSFAAVWAARVRRLRTSLSAPADTLREYRRLRAALRRAGHDR